MMSYEKGEKVCVFEKYQKRWLFGTVVGCDQLKYTVDWKLVGNDEARLRDSFLRKKPESGRNLSIENFQY